MCRVYSLENKMAKKVSPARSALKGQTKKMQPQRKGSNSDGKNRPVVKPGGSRGTK